MILATTIQSEKGKEIIKTANEFIEIILTHNKVQQYRIHFQVVKSGRQGDDNHIAIHDYQTGEIVYANRK